MKAVAVHWKTNDSTCGAIYSALSALAIPVARPINRNPIFKTSFTAPAMANDRSNGTRALQFRVAFRIRRVQMRGPVSMPLAHYDSSALIDVQQRSNSEAAKARSRNVHHGEHGVHGEERTPVPLRFLRLLSGLRGEIRHAPMSRTTHLENELPG